MSSPKTFTCNTFRVHLKDSFTFISLQIRSQIQVSLNLIFYLILSFILRISFIILTLIKLSRNRKKEQNTSIHNNPFAIINIPLTHNQSHETNTKQNKFFLTHDQLLKFILSSPGIRFYLIIRVPQTIVR